MKGVIEYMYALWEEKKHLTLDVYEEGTVIKALNDMRTKLLSEGKTTEFENRLLLKIINTPVRKEKTRDEAR